MFGFPDTAEAVVEALGRTNEDLLVTSWLASYDVLPAAHVYALPGVAHTESWERTDRVRVDVYGRDMTPTKRLANQLRDALTHGPLDTSFGLIDRVWCETEPAPVPYPDDTVIHVSFTLRAIVRHQPIPDLE